jgi:uncharacterized protein YciI
VLFAIMAEDVPDSAGLRAKYRAAHRARLTTLDAAGRLVLCGPHPRSDSEDDADNATYSGSLIVAEFADEEEARRWVDDDPYQRGGVFARVIIKPFVRICP